MLPTEVPIDILLDARNKLLLFLPNFWVPVVTDKSGISVLLLSRQTQLTTQRSVVFSVSGGVLLNVHCKPVSIEPFVEGVLPPIPLSDYESVNYFVDRAVSIVKKDTLNGGLCWGR